MSPFVRSLLAASILAVPVVAEALHLVEDDATPGVVLFGATQLVGWLLVGTVVRDLAAGVGDASRWGSRLVLAGVAFQALFAAVFLGTSLATGEPTGASFIAFLLGFLCLTVGGFLWSARLRRASHREVALGLGCVAFFGFVAIAVGDNVVHEISLPLSYLAWILVGRGVPAGPAPVGEELSAASR